MLVIHSRRGLSPSLLSALKDFIIDLFHLCTQFCYFNCWEWDFLLIFVCICVGVLGWGSVLERSGLLNVTLHLASLLQVFVRIMSFFLVESLVSLTIESSCLKIQIIWWLPFLLVFLLFNCFFSHLICSS